MALELSFLNVRKAVECQYIDSVEPDFFLTVKSELKASHKKILFMGKAMQYIGNALEGSVGGMSGGVLTGVLMSLDTGDGKVIATWTIAGALAASIVYPSYNYVMGKWA